MSCPDLMLLSQLLDDELAADKAASIRTHVDGCATCPVRLARLAGAAAAARDLATAHQEHAPHAPLDADCPSADRLAGWASRAASSDDLALVAGHLEACDRCLGETMRMAHLVRRLDAGASLDVPPVLAARVASRWAAAPPAASLTAIVIRVARAGVALLERHVVAPILDVELLPVAAAPVRAAARAETVSFRVRAPEAQIRATVVAEGDTVGLTLTLLGHADEALGGQRVSLRQDGRAIYSARTNAEGTLAMPRIEPGVYEVSCPGIGTTFRLDLR